MVHCGNIGPCPLPPAAIIHTFIRHKDSNKKQTDRQREIQHIEYQQKSMHTCIVCSISNEQFTGLLPNTAQSLNLLMYGSSNMCKQDIFVIPERIGLFKVTSRRR